MESSSMSGYAWKTTKVRTDYRTENILATVGAQTRILCN